MESKYRIEKTEDVVVQAVGTGRREFEFPDNR